MNSRRYSSREYISEWVGCWNTVERLKFMERTCSLSPYVFRYIPTCGAHALTYEYTINLWTSIWFSALCGQTRTSGPISNSGYVATCKRILSRGQTTTCVRVPILSNVPRIRAYFHSFIFVLGIIPLSWYFAQKKKNAWHYWILFTKNYSLLFRCLYKFCARFFFFFVSLVNDD